MSGFLATPEWLAERLERLAAFSAPGPGVTRLVYDDAWCDAHRWLQAEATALGLVATPDPVGNLLLHPPGLAGGSGALFVGSHLDSVAHGGRLDGAYGVVAALALAAESLGRRVPVVGFVTCEEEGSRFPAALTGVRALLGELDPVALADQRDAAGTRWADALAAARAGGCAAPMPRGGTVPAAPFRPVAQLELHIEQGPVLERAAEVIGVVDAIAGYRRMRLLVDGEPRHAGTTPMDVRRDAFAAAAEIALAAESHARAAGPPAVATAGFARTEPGLFNVVPGRAELGVEVRHADAASLATLAEALLADARAIAARRGVRLSAETVAAEVPAALDDGLAVDAEALARALALPHRRMASGAGHDTMAFARAGVPALMVFVPSRGGVSHSPDEHTSGRHLWTGLAFARALLARWDERFA